jgi:hypothetical protein
MILDSMNHLGQLFRNPKPLKSKTVCSLKIDFYFAQLRSSPLTYKQYSMPIFVKKPFPFGNLSHLAIL